jgi:hypothetical protein
MLYTKVKLFESVASASQPNGIEDLESRINEFLLQNPRVRLIDIKLISNPAPAGKSLTNPGCIALLIYEET